MCGTWELNMYIDFTPESKQRLTDQYKQRGAEDIRGSTGKLRT